MSKRTHSQMEASSGGATTTVEAAPPQQHQQAATAPLALGAQESRGIAEQDAAQQRKRRRPTRAAGDAPYFDAESALAALDEPYVLAKRQALAFLLARLQDARGPLSVASAALLLARAKVEPDMGVKALLLRCLVAMALRNAAQPSLVAEELSHQVAAAANKDVRAAALAGLAKIYGADLAEADGSLADGVLHHAAEQLRTGRPRTRALALLLLSTLAARRLEKEGSEAAEAHQGLLANYGSHDPDPRVRAEAFRALSSLHGRLGSLSLELYQVATNALTDDYPDVRLGAMAVLSILCNLHPDHMHDRGQGEMMRIADDGFIRICSMVMDASVEVRATACRLLGRIGRVDTRYLVQAFSKEILGRSGRGRLAKSKSNTVSAAGDFDLSNSADVDLLGSGAGAFVLGLEDEFHQVRTAALDSIRQLATESLPFARVAVDFMVDMFNDEIDAVRSNALHSLREMSEVVHLQEDQVHIALAVLHDTSAEIRWATYRLLAAIPLCNIQCTHSTVQALLAAMARHPEDTLRIYEALAGVGRNHGHFLEYLVEDLLQIDSSFLPVERSSDDGEYVGTLIGLCNAALSNPNILALLPEYATRHYGFLKEKFPSLFPQELSFSTAALPMSAKLWQAGALTDEDVEGGADNVNSSPATTTTTADSAEAMDQFFAESWKSTLASRSEGGDVQAGGSLEQSVRLLCQNMARMGQISPALLQRAACYQQLAKCLGIALGSLVEEGRAEELCRAAYELEGTFVGLSEESRARLAGLRAFAHLQLAVSGRRTGEGTVRALRQRLTALSTRSLPEGLRESVAAAVTAITAESEFTLAAANALALLQPTPWLLTAQDIRQGTARILAPANNPEAPVYFNALAPLRLRFAAQLEHVNKAEPLVILCKLPDHKVVVIPVEEGDLEEVEGGHLHLSKQLSVDIAQPKGWTEQCAVELQVAKQYTPDVENDCRGGDEGGIIGRRPMAGLGQPALVWAHAAEHSTLKKLKYRK